MRVAAEHDGLLHAQRKQDFLPLRQHADDPRELAPGPRSDRSPVDQHRSRARAAPAPDSARTSVVFPLPFGPTAATMRRFLDPATHARERGRAGATVAHRDVARLDDHASVLRSSTAKSGTPTSAVITPTGSSSGRTTTRDDDVAEHEKAAAGEEDERQQACDGSGGRPCARRGERRDPTKPMMPQAATLAAVSSAVHTYTDPHRALDVGAEVVGGLLAEREEIETAGIEARECQAGSTAYTVKTASDCHEEDAEPSQQPEECVPRRRGVGEHHDAAHERDEERARRPRPDNSSTRGSSRRPATRLSR